MKIYFMRHGQTNYNIQSLCNDDPTKDVHLTDTGIQQAEIVAQKLKSKPLDIIFISELSRTRQTADIINQYHHADIVPQPLINDITSGFDSQPVEEYKTVISHDPLHAKANNGESLLEHKQRVIHFIDWLSQQTYKEVLVVAHEETLRVVSAYFNQLPDEEMIELSFDNCEYYEFIV